MTAEDDSHRGLVQTLLIRDANQQEKEDLAELSNKKVMEMDFESYQPTRCSLI